MDFALNQEQRMIYEYGDRISKQFDHSYWRGYARCGAICSTLPWWRIAAGW